MCFDVVHFDFDSIFFVDVDIPYKGNVQLHIWVK